MTIYRPARTRIRRIFSAGLLAVAIALAYQSLASSSSAVFGPGDSSRSEQQGPRPAIDNLDPDLLGALRQAETDAVGNGLEFSVNSGWRSPGRQEKLFQKAIAQYGSEAEAARWVATPETSPHVSGDAVDLGPADATAWLSEHGAAYGLCQIYGNEPWHFELRPEAVDQGCPPLYPDPTYDPRMAQ
jgi:D-alanyl-D-alanine carboxypeptidase